MHKRNYSAIASILFLRRPNTINIIVAINITRIVQLKIRSIALSPDGKSLAGAGDSGNKGTLYVWDAHTFATLSAFESIHSGMTAVSFAPDNKTIVSG